MNVLVFAPHNDDEILGVGGTMKKHINAGDDVYVCEVTSGTHFNQLKEEAEKAHRLLGVRETFFLQQPVGRLRNLNQMELNGEVSKVFNIVKPTIVYMPFIGDMHIDHREVAESVLVAVRPIGNYTVREVYMYETVSETGWNVPNAEKTFSPNMWVDISDTIDDKLRAMECYQSQLLDYPHARSLEGIIALSKYRGSTVGLPHAECFMLVRRIIR